MTERSRLKNTNPIYYKPKIHPTHNIVYKWLTIDQGYTVKYLSNVLGISLEKVNPAFVNISKLTVTQVSVIILLLNGYKSEIEVLTAIFLNETVTTKEQEQKIKQIHDLIKLPHSNEPIYRADFEPNK